MDVYQFIGFIGILAGVFGFTRYYYIHEGYDEGVEEGQRNPSKPRTYENKKADEKLYRSQHKTVSDMIREVDEIDRPTKKLVSITSTKGKSPEQVGQEVFKTHQEYRKNQKGL